MNNHTENQNINRHTWHSNKRKKGESNNMKKENMKKIAKQLSLTHLMKTKFFKTLAVLGFITASAGIAFLLMGEPKKDPAITLPEWKEIVTPTQSEIDNKARLNELKKRISQKSRQYEADLIREQENFRKEFSDLIKNASAKTKSGIHPTINAFVDNGSSLVWAMAKDKVFNTDEADPKIDAILARHITTSMGEANREAETLLSAYMHRTREIANRYTAELQGTLAQFPEIKVDLSMLNTVNQTQFSASQKIRNAGAKAGWATVGVGAEMIFAKQTFNTVKTVATSVLKRAMAIPVKRAAGSVAAGAGCAVADGPLPIGDIIGCIIGIGGAAWTAWDLYDAYDTIKNQLPRELDESITKFFNELQTSVEKRADEWSKNLPAPATL